MALTRIKAQQISDIDYKQAVRVITLSNVTLSGGAPDTIDGVSLVTGDRILVAGQSTGSQNGLYDVTTLGTGANGTWARTADGDVTGEIQAGMIVMVTEGDTYKDSQWKLTTNNPIVIGTTPLAFEQNSAYAFGNIYANGTAVLANAVGGTVTFTAGDNIAITGNNTSKTVAIGVTGISLNSISNGTSNVNVVSSGGNVTVGVGGTGNVAVFAATGLYVDGIVSSTGNLSAANISTSGLISAAGNVTAANLTINNDAIITGNLTVNGNTTFINSNVVTTNDKAIVLANNQNTQANVDGAGIELGNNAVVSWTYSSSANAWTANVGMSTAGNIAGANLITNGLMSATGNVAGGNVLASGVVSAGANVTGGNILTDGTISATANVIGGNLMTAGVVSASGNITANYFLGNGSQLTGISATSIANGASNVTIESSDANVTVAIAGQANSAVFSQGALFSGLYTTPKTLTGNVVVAANSFGTIISGTVITGNLQIPDGTTVYTWTPS